MGERRMTPEEEIARLNKIIQEQWNEMIESNARYEKDIEEPKRLLRVLAAKVRVADQALEDAENWLRKHE
jgi:hypothetical protein